MNLGNLGNRRLTWGAEASRTSRAILTVISHSRSGAALYAFKWAEYMVVGKHKCTKQ